MADTQRNCSLHANRQSGHSCTLYCTCTCTCTLSNLLHEWMNSMWNNGGRGHIAVVFNNTPGATGGCMLLVLFSPSLFSSMHHALFVQVFQLLRKPGDWAQWDWINSTNMDKSVGVCSHMNIRRKQRSCGEYYMYDQSMTANIVFTLWQVKLKILKYIILTSCQFRRCNL